MKTQFREDQIQFINQEIETLPEHEKNILKMRYWECYSIDEIAFIHKLPQTLIKSLIDESIKRLSLNYLIEFSKPKDREVQCNQIAS
jgi:DNA-directed RNA polymerase specialized sigma24 family protein